MTERKKTLRSAERLSGSPALGRVNGKFAPGQSGNPSGRPKATPEEIDLLAKIKSLSPKAVTALESVLDDPDATADAKIRAANIVIERQLGKPRQEIDQTVTQNVPSPEDHKPDLSNLRQRAAGAASQREFAVTSPADSKPSLAH